MDVTTLILGAGAAGMMCAARAGPGALVIDHAKSPGEKIRISGGGRCNFTNLHTAPGNFISANPHFCKSALARYTQWDFIDLVARHGIGWHEKTLGQLFCDDRSARIIAMLRDEMDRAGAALWLRTSVADIAHDGGVFRVTLEPRGRACHRPGAPASWWRPAASRSRRWGPRGWHTDIARQFGHAATETRPALVPLTFSDKRFAGLSGTSLPARAAADGAAFDEARSVYPSRAFGPGGPAELLLA